MVTINPQFCPLPEFFEGIKVKMLVIDAETLEEAEQAEACALAKRWCNYMGGIARDAGTGRPSLVLMKAQ